MSLRVGAALRQHRVDLVIATAATAHVAVAGRAPTPLALDLTNKAARLLAENAALVTAQLGDADVENLAVGDPLKQCIGGCL